MLPAHSAPRSLLALILAAASWGLGTVISKRAVDEIPPLTLLPIQLAASLFALALLMRWRGEPLLDPAAPVILGRLGLLNPGLAYALSLIGLAHITASLSVLLWAAEPLLILLLAALVLREHIGPGLLALSGLALAGMTLVIYEPGSGSIVGVALTLAGVACCAVYTVVSRRWLGTVDTTAPVVVAQQVHALGFALIVAAASVVVEGDPIPPDVSLTAWASAMSSGVLYYGAAYWFYLSALREMPASSAAASFYLIPIFGVGGGLLLLGEQLAPTQWFGAAIVLIAVALILRRSAHSGAAEPASQAVSRNGSASRPRRSSARGPLSVRAGAGTRPRRS